jgi:SAM-dependent methyltransferase
MSDYWDGRAVTLEGAQRAAWDEDEDDGHCADMLQELLPWTHPKVEIGCGPGRLLGYSGAVGVDSSPNMVRWALDLRHPAVLNDGQTLPFPDESVAAVYSVLVFQHIPDEVVGSYCAEAWRILKPGGVFVAQYVTMGDVGPHNHPRTTGEMATLLWSWFRPGATVEHIDDPQHFEWAWIRCTK